MTAQRLSKDHEIALLKKRKDKWRKLATSIGRKYALQKKRLDRVLPAADKHHRMNRRLTHENAVMKQALQTVIHLSYGTGVGSKQRIREAAQEALDRMQEEE